MINYDNSSVRRQERLLDEQTTIELLRNGEYGVLSMVEQRDGAVAGYGIPINYVWDGGRYIYFHCAPEGHKLDSLNCSDAVSFTIVGKTNVISRKFTTAYQSVIVRGHLARGLSSEERMAALRLFLEKYSPADIETGLKYAEKSFHRTEILRLAIDHTSGKSKSIGV